MKDKLTSAWSSPNSTRFLHNKKLILALWRVGVLRRRCAPRLCFAQAGLKSHESVPNKKPPEWVACFTSGVFAFGEYSSPCRRLASGRRSAAGMRTPFVLKHKQGTMSHDILPNKKPPARGGSITSWVFAFGEYSSPCRRLASGRRSAAGMRTPFVLKHKQDTMSHESLPNKKPPLGLPTIKQVG